MTELEDKELRQVLRVGFMCLDDREKFILKSIYINGRTITDTARMIGRTNKRVVQIRDYALKKLAGYMKEFC